MPGNLPYSWGQRMETYANTEYALRSKAGDLLASRYRMSPGEIS